MRVLMEDFDFDAVLDAHRRRWKRRKTMKTSPKMACGSFYIPKSNPEKPLREDSHFIFEAEQAIGVANVGGWARKGIDAGVYARQLMTSAAAYISLNGLAGVETDPMNALRVAYASAWPTSATAGSGFSGRTGAGSCLRSSSAGSTAPSSWGTPRVATGRAPPRRWSVWWRSATSSFSGSMGCWTMFTHRRSRIYWN